MSFKKNNGFIKAETVEGLRDKLDRIYFPYSLTSVYHDGTSHIAVIKTDRPLTKKLMNQINKGE